jgi:isopentenyl diphosphate isomerase/L-lactate dehydrogenase-like FMN-dependent dehydrogenase
MRECRAAFERIKLRPRVLVDVSPDAIDMNANVLGVPVSLPVLIAPMALHCMAHPEGECATAQGAGRAGTLMIASTVATRSIEEIAQAASGPLWFQLYTYPTLKVAESLVRRAEDAGYRAIVLTVDLPALGNREKDRRNNVVIPPSPYQEANFIGVEKIGQRWVTLTWESLAWLRSITSLPIMLKGILTEEDARLAIEHGVDGIVVTNHGGRQLDTAIPSIEALPEIVEAVAGRCEVYLDGGIRRGTDILKALALGARAVLVGRPVLWGLAANGADGVYHVLELLRKELELAMALSGRPTLASIDRSLVRL